MGKLKKGKHMKGIHPRSAQYERERKSNFLSIDQETLSRALLEIQPA